MVRHCSSSIWVLLVFLSFSFLTALEKPLHKCSEPAPPSVFESKPLLPAWPQNTTDCSPQHCHQTCPGWSGITSEMPTPIPSAVLGPELFLCPHVVFSSHLSSHAISEQHMGVLPGSTQIKNYLFFPSFKTRCWLFIHFLLLIESAAEISRCMVAPLSSWRNPALGHCPTESTSSLFRVPTSPGDGPAVHRDLSHRRALSQSLDTGPFQGLRKG